MSKLTKREDQIMNIVWKLQKAVIRDIVDEFPDPKPHYNTVATLVKILVKKGALLSVKIGNTHLYSPAQDFESYRDEQLGKVKQQFFDNSLPKMMAHFAKSEKLTDEERAELIRIINSKGE